MPANRKAEVDAAVKDVDFNKNTYQIEFDTSKGKILLDLWRTSPRSLQKHHRPLENRLLQRRHLSPRHPRFHDPGRLPLGTGTGDAATSSPGIQQEVPHHRRPLHGPRPGPEFRRIQFFICVADAKFLDGQYTAFGKTAGADSDKVALSIALVDRDRSDKPLQP